MSYDVAIIGGGISGLSAAIFTGHAGLRTVVFDTEKSQIKSVPSLRNYLGINEVSGDELLETYREQAKDYVEYKNVEVESIQKIDDIFSLQADGETYVAERVVIATNLRTNLLESLGLDIGINENVKSGKVKKVIGINWNGETTIPKLYVAGLLTGIPSQALIASGQGAAVGVKIAQEVTGEKYMWHDS